MDAAIRACRRINDFALAVRYLEAVKVGECFTPGTLSPEGLLLGERGMTPIDRLVGH